MAKFVAFLSTTSLIFVLIAIIVYLRLFGSGAAHRTLDRPAVVKEVQQLNELVTVKYSIEKVVGIKEQISPVGTESILPSRSGQSGGGNRSCRDNTWRRNRIPG